MENDVSKVSEHVVQPGYTLWTVGYILRLDAAKQLLETHAEQHMWLGVAFQEVVCIELSLWTELPCSSRGFPWTISFPYQWVVGWMDSTTNGL